MCFVFSNNASLKGLQITSIHFTELICSSRLPLVLQEIFQILIILFLVNTLYSFARETYSKIKKGKTKWFLQKTVIVAENKILWWVINECFSRQQIVLVGTVLNFSQIRIRRLCFFHQQQMLITFANLFAFCSKFRTCQGFGKLTAGCDSTWSVWARGPMGTARSSVATWEVKYCPPGWHKVEYTSDCPLPSYTVSLFDWNLRIGILDSALFQIMN